jgi:hypothetical protein
MCAGVIGWKMEKTAFGTIGTITPIREISTDLFRLCFSVGFKTPGGENLRDKCWFASVNGWKMEETAVGTILAKPGGRQIGTNLTPGDDRERLDAIIKSWNMEKMAFVSMLTWDVVSKITTDGFTLGSVFHSNSSNACA